ncbi:hypothetical protein G7Y89_g13355 [Cudoniella acicularis]|uniref:Tim44-like domain-containing protein n=1 Tax=Cudoniella acicularis TaxID=354080 RepID=A0A8H4RA21_9HELO|nr:hypothetical protein G7Y89_g13355 [Cudoniella acicularis]
MGLLQDTYIHPSFRNQPSPIQEPLSAFKLQWNRIRFKFRDLFSLIILKYSSPKGKSSFGRRELKLNSSIIIPTALALHKQMYSSFAAAETPTLRKICCDGIYDSFRARIASRPRGEQVTWELVKYNRRAKLVGNRAARFPIDGAAVRQAVVRICSTQRLTRARNGVVVGGSGKEKDVVEYVVVQRTYSNWRPGDWQIWGTTRETSLEEVKGWLNRGV